MMTHEQATRLDDDTAGGMSSTILVLGRGPSAVTVVRGADVDWELRAWAPARLSEKIDAEQAKGGDCWLVAIEEGHAAELDRDPAVIAYAPAWRRKAG
jgi:hypothetical protein